MRRLFYAIFSMSFGLLAGPALADAVLNSAGKLIADGHADKAYEQLVPLEFERAGEPEFDYLIGIAGLQSGRPGLAILAFERVLAVNPGHAAARLDTGRAYYALGDLDRAEQAFAVARELGPPPSALATIENYEKAIAARRDPRKLRLTGHVEVSAGTDGNVNQATSRSSIAIPAFGGSYTLGGASLARRDDYASVTAGGEARMALDERLSLHGGADFQVRDYGKLNAYDISSGDFRGGLAFAEGRNLYRLTAGYNDYRLESERYRGVASMLAEWRHGLDAATALSLSAQYNEIRYVPDSLRGSDVNVALVAGGISRVLDGARKLTLEAGAFAGSEREERLRTDGNRWLGGLRVGAAIALRDELDLFASLSAQMDIYSRYNSLFLTRRRDAQYDLGLGASWRFAPDWSVRPQLAVTRADSNLAIYDTLRYDLSLSLRRDFR